jgi:hypothetical protein
VGQRCPKQLAGDAKGASMIDKLFEKLKAEEGNEELISALDKLKKDFNTADQTVREQKVKLDQIGDLDVTALTAINKWVEDNGGREGLQKALAEAEGYKDDAGKLKAKEDEWNNTQLEMNKKYEESQKSLDLANLKNEVLPKLSEAFGSAAGDIFELAMSKGQITRGETGLLAKFGDKVESFDKEGFETLKETYKYALQAPSGGGKTGGIGGNDNSGGSATSKLEDEFR